MCSSCRHVYYEKESQSISPGDLLFLSCATVLTNRRYILGANGNLLKTFPSEIILPVVALYQSIAAETFSIKMYQSVMKLLIKVIYIGIVFGPNTSAACYK